MSVTLAAGHTVSKASTKLSLAALFGVGVSALVWLSISTKYALLVGWDAAVLAYLLDTWPRLLRYNGTIVKQHALREDPSRVATDAIILSASVASLVAVASALINAQAASGAARIGEVVLGLTSVVLAWLLVHTVFALRYAEIYFKSTKAPIDFGDTRDPHYIDFAYMAFTLGMTFQVSDTVMKTRELRRTALRHAFLSYIFGTVIIATTINLIAGLGK